MKHGRFLSLTRPEPDLFQLHLGSWSTLTGDSDVQLTILQFVAKDVEESPPVKCLKTGGNL